MLNQKQRDAITEIVNIGVGRGASTLSDIISTEIVLNVPLVNVISFDRIGSEVESINTEVIHAVELEFYGEYEGISNVILLRESASHLVAMVTEQYKGLDSLEEMKDGILSEVGNIILNAVMGSFGNILNIPFTYRIPQIFKGNLTSFFDRLDEQKYKQILICRTNFMIKGKAIKGEILVVYETNSFDKLKGVLDAVMT